MKYLIEMRVFRVSVRLKDGCLAVYYIAAQDESRARTQATQWELQSHPDDFPSIAYFEVEYVCHLDGQAD